MVKVYRLELDEGHRRRYFREAAAAGRLSDHLGIVTAHGAGILPDDRPYLIMELCPGGSLAQWLRPENRPSDEQVRQVGVRIADALAAVHACGVLHRDVRPANILIDNFGNPRLADFGLAAVAGAEAAAADGMGTTPAYAPPESFGTQWVTPSGDVFSLAATLYALLAGRPPRHLGTAVTLEQMLEIARKPIDPLPGVNWHLMDVLMAALSSDPAARPTAARFRDQLADLSAAQVASVEAPRRGRRRESILALAAAMVTVVASSTAWLVSLPGAESAASGGLSSSANTSSADHRAVPPRADPEPSTPTTSSDPRDNTGSRPVKERTIRLELAAERAKPWQTVPIQGIYRGGADTLLRVQRWEGGRWLAFPLPTKTDRSGQFSAFVELGEPSRYRLRVLDPDSGVKSKAFVLEIKRLSTSRYQSRALRTASSRAKDDDIVRIGVSDCVVPAATRDQLGWRGAPTL